MQAEEHHPNREARGWQHHVVGVLFCRRDWCTSQNRWHHETRPNQAALLLDTMPIQPTAHLATWSACTVPGPPQESLVRDETRLSLPAKPSLTQTTLGQLCAAPWASRSRPAVTEPGLEPRISGGTASTEMQCLRPLYPKHLTQVKTI